MSFWEEMEVLLPLHYEELCVTKDPRFPVNPDKDAYQRMADQGRLRAVTVREADTRLLVGYIFFIITPQLHYKDCLLALEDVYFIHPEYRQGRVGIRLFKYAEEVLKRIGVQRIFLHTKVHMDVGRLFEYLDYKFTDKVYVKTL